MFGPARDYLDRRLRRLPSAIVYLARINVSMHDAVTVGPRRTFWEFRFTLFHSQQVPVIDVSDRSLFELPIHAPVYHPLDQDDAPER